jgi:ribonuclease HI
VTPVVEIHAPYQVENDKDDIIARAVATRQAAVAAIPPNERFAYACALNRHSAGVDLILKDFLPELTQQLQSVPEINLWGIQHNTNEAGLIPDGEYIVRFSQFTYTKAGEERSARSVAVVVDGVEKQFASINERSMHLPIGTLVQADIRIEGKVAYMQVKELLEPPPLHRVSQAERSTPTGAITTSAAPLEPLLIVTDGACKGNPGSGGWGAILMQGNSYHEIGGGGLETTNNRMEMTAGIEALKDAKAKGMVERDTPITIISDSQLFINGATGAWQRKANLDLWAEYDRAASGLNLQFQWVKGHNGHELNERVDAIAQAFARGQQPALEQDAPPSPPIASAPAPSEAMPSDVSIPSFPPPLPSESTEPHLDFSTVADAPSSHASPAYDPESLVGYQPLTGADSSTVQSHASTYHPSRGELLEWLAVARVIGSSEQQETIKALGLTLRDHYNQEQGMSEAAPPTQYRHSAVAVNEQAYLQMRDAVVQLRESFSQMSLQPHQTPAAMLHVPQDRVQHLQIQHEIG